MPFRIQRVPRGLNELLSIFGGGTPQDLEDRVRPIIDLLQYYGTQQRRLLQGTNAALARGGLLSAGILDSWSVLFSANAQITKTATMNAATMSLFASGGSVNMGVASQSFDQGPGVVDGLWRMSWVAPYPMICSPQTNFFGALDQCTDANALVSVSFSVGILG